MIVKVAVMVMIMMTVMVIVLISKPFKENGRTGPGYKKY